MKFSISLLAITASLIMISGVHGEKLDHPVKGVITASRVNCRNNPDPSGKVIATLNKNSEVTILEDMGSWYKISLSNTGVFWVSKNFISPQLNPINSRGLGNRNMISYAKNLINSAYHYGGNSPNGFDCSGFTKYVYAKFGFQIPHSSSQQMELGYPIDKSELLPADLVFFSTRKSKMVSHVGIYIGENQFVHAASSSRRVRISNLNESYYQKRFIGARRLIDYPISSSKPITLSDAGN